MAKIEENSSQLDEAINSVRGMFLVFGVDFDEFVDREIKSILTTYSKEFHLNYLKIRKKRKYKNK